VIYQVGNPHFRGQTTVTVFEDAQAQVRFEQGEQISEFKGVVADGDYLELQDFLAEEGLPIPQKEVVPKPDETRIMLTIGEGDLVETRAYWSSEQWQDASLRSLVLLFNRVATAVSKGQVRF
jgi:hypothetical protein